MGQLGLAAPESSAEQLFLTASLQADGAAPSQAWCVFLSVIAEVHEGSESKRDVSCSDPDRAVIFSHILSSEASGVTKSRAEGPEVCLPTVSRGRAAACSPPWLTASLSSPLLSPPHSHA